MMLTELNYWLCLPEFILALRSLRLAVRSPAAARLHLHLLQRLENVHA